MTIKQYRRQVLSMFTIGDLDNEITRQSITDKLESIDNLYKERPEVV